MEPSNISCQVDDEGLFGQSSTNIDSIEYKYIMRYSTKVQNPKWIIGKLEGVISNSILTSTQIFQGCYESDERSLLRASSASSSNRKLSQNIIGMKSSPDDAIDQNQDCPSEFINSDSECKIVNGEMSLYYTTEENKSTDIHNTILDLIEKGMADGSFANEITRIKDLSYITPQTPRTVGEYPEHPEQPTVDQGDDNTIQDSSSGWITTSTLGFISVGMSILIILVALVAMQHRHKKQKMAEEYYDGALDDSSVSTCASPIALTLAPQTFTRKKKVTFHDHNSCIKRQIDSDESIKPNDLYERELLPESNTISSERSQTNEINDNSNIHDTTRPSNERTHEECNAINPINQDVSSFAQIQLNANDNGNEALRHSKQSSKVEFVCDESSGQPQRNDRETTSLDQGTTSTAQIQGNQTESLNERTLSYESSASYSRIQLNPTNINDEARHQNRNVFFPAEIQPNEMDIIYDKDLDNSSVSTGISPVGTQFTDDFDFEERNKQANFPWDESRSI
jgi:hypothetical protein